jgi:hypothetical protein
MDVCPPYTTPGDYVVFTNGETFKMAGNDYGNGFTLGGSDNSILFNLNGQYSTIELYVAHWDGFSSNSKKASFYLDGKLIKEVDVGNEDMPQKITLPVSGGLQFKINVSGSYSWNNLGFGEITVK